MAYPESAMPRRYQSPARAQRQEETRRRIVAATVELHRSVGPARTEISAVAERAGVERVTVYRHFPRLESLLAACSEHFRSTHPLPDPAEYRRIADPRARLAAALQATYAYYGRNRQMLANVLRDAAVMPVGGGFLDFQERMAEALAAGWNLRGRRRSTLLAALRLAVDFHTWESLVQRSHLAGGDAVALMAAAVESVAG